LGGKMAETQIFLEYSDAEQTIRHRMECVANNILSLPDIENPEIWELTRHIHAAKAHASDYLSNLSMEMDLLYDETKKYGKQLEATANDVSILLKMHRPGYSDMIKDAISDVLESGNSFKKCLNQLITDISAFDNEITADARSLLSDQQTVQLHLSEDEDQLRNLAYEMELLRVQLESERRAEIIVGIFTFGIGAAIMELSIRAERLEEHIRDANIQAKYMNQQINELHSISLALAAFINGTTILSGLAINLEKEWQTVVANLKEVTDHKVTECFIEAAIKSILLDWNDVVKIVEGLRN